ncbi:MAG: hypothetical protein NT084_09865 [Bacteroidetes bacterium]|nr:hypothetical protein [Bacteroidota bacterium]
MESNKVLGIFERISSSILSSNSLLQLETAERLLNLFQQQNIQPELNEKLNIIFVNKAKTLHYFEWKSFRDCGLEAA